MTDIADLMPSFRSEYDENSLGMLTDILSTLYANPERSVLREYIANAIDAHKIAGVTRPVEVTLPDNIQPTLVIRDYGDGLDMDALRNTFFKYVASTKTDDNSQIGALGIGAKSAFALSKSWTVTNVYNGLKYIVASVNDPYGPPKQTVIVNGEATDEPSGITVTIPINDRYIRHDWKTSATRLMRWFPKGSVEFISNNPHDTEVDTAHWTDVYTSYGNMVWDLKCDKWRSAYGSSDMYVVMSGIAYAIDSTTKDQITSVVRDGATAVITEVEGAERYAMRSQSPRYANAGFACRFTDEERTAKEVNAHVQLMEMFTRRVFNNTLMVDAGDIDFMPSRESVKGTPRTVDTIANAVLDAVRKFCTDIAEIRKLDPPKRVRASRKFYAHVIPDASEGTVLEAVGVHNIDTGIYRKSEKMGLHGLINRAGVVGGHATLVTGVAPGATLFKINVVEIELGRKEVFYTTPRDDSVIPGFGSIEGLFKGASSEFSPAMTVDDYRAVAKEVAPASRRSGGTITHRWWRMVPNSDVGLLVGESTFDDLMDELIDEDITVYITNERNFNTFRSAAHKGVSGIAIQRGRRRIETFERELGRETRNMVQLDRDTEEAWTTKCVESVKLLSTDTIRQIATYRDADLVYVAAVRRVLESDYGALIGRDHAARRFVEDYELGKRLYDTDSDTVTMVYYVMDVVSKSSATIGRVPADVRDVLRAVEGTPWPLIRGGFLGDDEKSLQHAAVYLAAVG